MEELYHNLYLLRSLREFVESKNTHYYDHIIINEHNITNNTISIVMTSHERSKQVYFTLETINRCLFKDLQVIIIDDSSNDKLNVDELSNFGFHIELIKIKREFKYWANPCINYNIGFQYIRGGKVIIQNGEVCYIGDILSYVNNNVVDTNYYVFDVKASRNFYSNNLLYEMPYIETNIYNENIWLDNVPLGWYQHSIYRNTNYHFLVATTRDTFNKIGGFSYDYSFGSCFDDDDLVLKIKYNNINIINVKNEIEKIGGIHLYHGYTENITNTNAYTKPQNENLFSKKRNYTNKTNNYLELSNNIDYMKLLNDFNELNQY